MCIGNESPFPPMEAAPPALAGMKSARPPYSRKPPRSRAGRHGSEGQARSRRAMGACPCARATQITARRFSRRTRPRRSKSSAASSGAAGWFSGATSNRSGVRSASRLSCRRRHPCRACRFLLTAPANGHALPPIRKSGSPRRHRPRPCRAAPARRLTDDSNESKRDDLGQVG
jgi:hypothetical protein